jgi:AcrR family transcriptional regulator
MESDTFLDESHHVARRLVTTQGIGERRTMARKATKQATALAGDGDAPEIIPEWKRESVERSLQAARARAQERTDRFVATTIELMHEKGSTDFTVQDVIDRSKMSIRTFYNFFETKDDLLVAVHETILTSEVVNRLRERCASETDPIRRIQAYITGLFDLASLGGPASRALTTYYNRLAETRPASLDRAFQPLIDLVVTLVEDAAVAGFLESDMSTELAAHLLHHTVLAAVHSRILGSEIFRDVSPEDLWKFCANGIGVKLSA